MIFSLPSTLEIGQTILATTYTWEWLNVFNVAVQAAFGNAILLPADSTEAQRVYTNRYQKRVYILLPAIKRVTVYPDKIACTLSIRQKRRWKITNNKFLVHLPIGTNWRNKIIGWFLFRETTLLVCK